MQDKLLICIKIKKTIQYVEKAVQNYPHMYLLLKTNILKSFYELLELSYRASLYKNIDSIKEMVVKIKMIEYYLNVSCDKKLISFKKFENIGKYLLELNLMVNGFIKNEKNKQSI